VQGIFGWLLLIEKGDTLLLVGRFRYLSVNTVQQLAPSAVAAACVVGFFRQQIWAWWLTLGAISYELVMYLPHIKTYDLSPGGASGLLKLAWLVALIALLLASGVPNPLRQNVGR
jgi:hypothetical protein